MASPTNFPGDVVVPGDMRLTGSITPAMSKANVLAIASLQAFTVPMSMWREDDNYATPLPVTPIADDNLGLVSGTFGTNAPSLQTLDSGGNAAVKTYKARAEIPLPWNYVAGNPVSIRCHAGMKTVVADQTCTLDVEVYKSDEDGTSTGDLYAGAALSINSITFIDKDFSLTATSLNPGDLLDVVLTVSIDDNGDANPGITGVIGSVQLLSDVR